VFHSLSTRTGWPTAVGVAVPWAVRESKEQGILVSTTTTVKTQVKYFGEGGHPSPSEHTPWRCYRLGLKSVESEAFIQYENAFMKVILEHHK